MAKPYAYRCVMIGQGAAPDPKTIPAGTTGQALRVATTGDEPTFGTLDAAAVLGTTKVPTANGGTAIDTSASTGVAQVAAGVWSVSAVDLATADVTGIMPLANGGTNSLVGAVAIMQFSGVAVAAGSTVFLGHGADVTEANIWFPAPMTGVVVRATIVTSAAPVGTETFTYRVRIAGALAAAAQVITGSATTSDSGVIAAAVTRLETVNIRLVTSAGAAVVNHMVTLAILVTG